MKAVDSPMFAPNRDEARKFFFETWRKHRQREILSGLEDTALAVILQHPEYHKMLDDAERFLERDYLPEMGETNPFLHMSMHLAIEEQLSIDQPRGIRGLFERIFNKTADRHEALHTVMDCLGEMIWQAQRHHTTPDEKIYLECLERQLQ